jgi:hypothetical protein
MNEQSMPPNLNLPQELSNLDESLLPEHVRAKIEQLVRLGNKRRHMMVSRNLEVHISPELVQGDRNPHADD